MTFKTFNISTGASIVAAAGGVCLARHGARAITSRCGTVDLCEMLGVDVECSADTVQASIEQSGLGLFNCMSPTTHPQALFRILSQMSFGSILNIAASLANPANPAYGVRGVYAWEMIDPVIQTMREMGFQEYLEPELQGYIITSFLYPDDPNFSFEKFYESLNQKDYVIYPGKVSDADCFRIGNIGRIFEPDVRALLAAIRETIEDMGVKLK